VNFTMILRLAGLLASMCVITYSQSLQTSDVVVKTWERVLLAKGGRQRLEAISNFLTIQRTNGRSSRIVHETLIVFPKKRWAWVDLGAPFSTSINANNGSYFWEAYDKSRYDGTGIISGPTGLGDERDLIQDQAIFLMETRGYHPKLLSSSLERIGREEFDVVSVDSGLGQIKYYIDKKTSLVRRIASTGKNGNIVAIPVDFSDYRSVQGIMMPSKLAWGSGPSDNLEFAFDVDYDPAIFTRPPALEDGPEGWKR